MDLEEFIKSEKENTRANNRLRVYKDDITKMRQASLSYKSIQKYLDLNGVTISIQAISKFVRTHIETSGNDDKPKTKMNAQTPKEQTKKSSYVPPAWAGDVNIDDLM